MTAGFSHCNLFHFPSFFFLFTAISLLNNPYFILDFMTTFCRSHYFT